MRRMILRVAVLAVLLLMVVGAAGYAGAYKYRFVMVSHIGSNDPNMKWLTLSLAEFEKRYPDVKTEYISTNEYSLQKFVELLRQAIATKPNGIAVPIVSSDALAPVLKQAIAQGIPVVAFNIPDPRPAAQRIPYLTYVGGDEYLTGLKLGQRALGLAKDGKIPTPKQVLCAIHDAAHQGLKLRCKGMADAMKTVSVKVDNLFISADPARARSIMQSYLSKNKNVNYIFAVASWSSPWAYGVAKELGRDPGVSASSGTIVITVDESPVALEGIKQGKLLETHSQGFWLQGYAPMEILYWYQNLGLWPQQDFLTGPVIIDSTNVARWVPFVRNIFGSEYDKQVTW